MTLTSIDKIKCACCGFTNELEVLVSTNSMGSPDTDTRPS